MADRKRKSNATSHGDRAVDASAESGSSGPDNSGPTDTPEHGPTRDSRGGESTGVIDTTPTTAEEAMDKADIEDGFVDESAYAPTDR
jgi:hypothetical protein